MLGEAAENRELQRALDGVGNAIQALGGAVTSAEFSVVSAEPGSDGVRTKIVEALDFLQGVSAKLREIVSAGEDSGSLSIDGAEAELEAGAAQQPDQTPDDVALEAGESLAVGVADEDAAVPTPADTTDDSAELLPDSGEVEQASEAVADTALDDHSVGPLAESAEETADDAYEQQVERLRDWVSTLRGKYMTQQQLGAVEHLFRNAGKMITSTEFATAGGFTPKSQNAHSFVYNLLRRRLSDGDEFEGYVLRIDQPQGKKGRLLGFMPIESSEGEAHGATEEHVDQSEAESVGASANDQISDEAHQGPDDEDTTKVAEQLLLDELPQPTVDLTMVEQLLFQSMIENTGVPRPPREYAARAPGAANLTLKTLKQVFPLFIAKLKQDPFYGPRIQVAEQGESRFYMLDLSDAAQAQSDESQQNDELPTPPAAPPQEQDGEVVQEESEPPQENGADITPYTHLTHQEKALFDFLNANAGIPVAVHELWTHATDIGLDIHDMSVMERMVAKLEKDPLLGGRIQVSGDPRHRRYALLPEQSPSEPSVLVDGSGEEVDTSVSARKGAVSSQQPSGDNGSKPQTAGSGGERRKKIDPAAVGRRQMGREDDFDAAMDYVLSGTDETPDLPLHLLRKIIRQFEGDRLSKGQAARLEELRDRYDTALAARSGR